MLSWSYDDQKNQMANPFPFMPGRKSSIPLVWNETCGNKISIWIKNNIESSRNMKIILFFFHRVPYENRKSNKNNNNDGKGETQVVRNLFMFFISFFASFFSHFARIKKLNKKRKESHCNWKINMANEKFIFFTVFLLEKKILSGISSIFHKQRFL